MKIKLISTVIASTLLSFSAFAETEVLEIKGIGIDGKSCSARIVRDGADLKEVDLKGGAKVYQILGEKGGDYGSTNDINSYGGSEVLSLLTENPKMFAYMKYSEALFSDTETYTLDTSDLPMKKTGDMKGLKMKLGLKLEYKDGELVRVSAGSKAKALWVATVASSQFSCDVE